MAQNNSASGDSDYQTFLGEMGDFKKGGVEVINDDPKAYAFSNVFEVAANAAPYERVVVAKNMEYAIECIRAEGASPSYTCAHDETFLCMGGEIEIELFKPAAALLAPDSEGAHLAEDQDGKLERMGRLVLGKGHMALLPANSVYRFKATDPSLGIFQTLLGPVSVERWSEICQTA